MTLLEEKKLVADWMGWEFENGLFSWLDKSGVKTRKVQDHKYWNPHRNRNCWPDIWERMDRKTIIAYKYALGDSSYVEDKVGCTLRDSVEWKFHTAPPEVCWKALVSVLTKGE